MRTIGGLVVVMAALMGCWATAGAVTWENSGDTAFTSVGTPGTFTVGGVTISCASSTATTTVSPSPFAGDPWPVEHTTEHYPACSAAGQPATLHCTEAFTATVSDLTTPVTTTGTLDVTCDEVIIFGVNACRVTGTFEAARENPNAPSTPSRMNLAGPGSLVITNGDVPCPLGNGVPVLASPRSQVVVSGSGGPSPHLGPSYARTP